MSVSNTSVAQSASANAAVPASTPTATTTTDITSNDDWGEFCDKQARTSASDFAKAFFTYISVNLSENARASLSHRDFLRKFIETFCDHFESEYLRRSARYVYIEFCCFVICKQTKVNNSTCALVMLP